MLGQHPGRTFISYSRKDGAEFAADLRKTLEKENLSVWQDIVAFEGGRDWWSQIEDAFTLSRSFVRLEWRLAPPPPKPRTGAKAGGAGSRKSLWCFTRQDSVLSEFSYCRLVTRRPELALDTVSPRAWRSSQSEARTSRPVHVLMPISAPQLGGRTFAASCR
jgi:TIR domain